MDWAEKEGNSVCREVEEGDWFRSWCRSPFIWEVASFYTRRPTGSLYFSGSYLDRMRHSPESDHRDMCQSRVDDLLEVHLDYYRYFRELTDGIGTNSE